MSYDNSNTIRDPLIEHGFDTNYTCWNLHGEIPPQVDNDTIVSDFNMDENFGNDDNHRDNLDEMLHDAERCKKFTKLSLVVRLLDLKEKNNWSDKSFTTLLELLHEAFPEDNELPVTTYHVKKLTCPMGLAVERIHVCRKDCILYRKDYKDLHECPVCKASRYKHHKNLTELDSDVTKNGPPAKMLWYLPIIPRLKNLYANPKDGKLLHWHAEERKTDGKMRHVADSPQWKNIDRDFKKFGSEIRNIRFGLYSDGINPFKSLSSRHSTWPVLLCPKQPGNDIDVYLRPLIDDMIDLWETCVEIYDAYKKERFQLFAMIYCTINDFPAYGNLSGYGMKGEKACPICENGTHSRWLTNCRKTIYMRHRRALHRHHPYRKKENIFDGISKDRSMPKLMDGYPTLSQVADLNITFGKKVKAPPKHIWKKRSIFWELKYWTHILVRHCLDVMHIEKNVCESLLGLLFNIPGKTKDGVNARKDMLATGIRSELAPQETNGKKIYLPPACYTLSKAKKTSFCECLHVVDHEKLEELQRDIILILCQLEMYFPPSFFDVMVHLVSHIVEEIKIAGPVFLRYMYPFERYIGFLKGYVRNRYRPKGSIIQGYAAEEVVQFCTNYMDDVTDIGLPQPRHQGRLEGVETIGRKDVTPNTEDLEQAHFTVLQNMTCIEPYIQEHMSYLARKNGRREQRWLEAEHKKTFSQWLADKVIGYDINGYTFYTKKQDDKSTVQNSGVTLIATTTDSSRMEIAKDSYYGVIEEI
nr:hypothetical protein [Tanacetum cinerariifolium]